MLEISECNRKHENYYFTYRWQQVRARLYLIEDSSLHTAEGILTTGGASMVLLAMALYVCVEAHLPIGTGEGGTFWLVGRTI